MVKQWKYWLCAIMFVGAFIAGYMVRKPEIQEKIVKEFIKGETKTITKREIVTVKPDGSTKTIKETIDSVDKIESKVDTNSVQKKNRKVGVSVVSPKVLDLQKEDFDYKLNYSHRIYSDWWIDSSFQIKDKSISLGISKEF